MALKKRQVEERLCDLCSRQVAFDRCIVCNHDVCWACKDRGRTLHVSVWFTTSHDEVVCSKCVQEGRSLPRTERIDALLEIERLRNEYHGFITDFRSRMDAAEARVEACK